MTTQDLINRLRDTASKGVSVWGDLQMEAAKEIETLLAERECYASAMDRMQAALAEPSEPVSDLVERLQLGDGSSPDHALLLEAANAIEHLIGELRKGLKQEEILENKLFKEIHKSTPDPVAYLVLFEGAGKLLEFTKGNYLHGAKVEHIPLFTHPASKPSEPVMIYHGGCTIDCGEHGHHNMEMLKLIPAGTKLFTHPASKPEPSEPVAEVAGDYNTKHIIFLPAGIALEVGDKLFTHPTPPRRARGARDQAQHCV